MENHGVCPNCGAEKVFDERNQKGQFIKGRILSEKMKQKISKTEKGKIIPPDVRIKMSNAHRGEKSYNWKGGVHKRKDGYVLCESGKKYQHRKLFEQYLGRKLTEKEVIHHIDGDTSNNDIENLFLFRHNTAHLRLERFQNRYNFNLLLKTNHQAYGMFN